MTPFADRRAAFRDLHRAGCFALPNPWDGGTALRCARAGFKALASTSAGAAWALGLEDGAMDLDQVLDHLRFLCGVTDLPVNADFEAGFADTPDGVAASVARCVGTGVAGLSIEDRDGEALIPFADAVARMRAARAAIDRSGADVVLVGRCEAYLMPTLDLDEVVRRLRAYGDAGADCLYAPGLKTPRRRRPPGPLRRSAGQRQPHRDGALGRRDGGGRRAPRQHRRGAGPGDLRRLRRLRRPARRRRAAAVKDQP